MRSHLVLALALAIGSGTTALSLDATAQTASAVRATAELSMVLTGSIDVAADGSVSKLVLDQREALAPGMAGFVESTISGWHFEPRLQNGAAVAVHAPLRVRLKGKPSADGGLNVSMTSVDFTEYDKMTSNEVTSIRLSPPRYPEVAFRSGAQGDVTLLVNVGRDGKVIDVIAEQVNLGVVAPGRTMQQLRDLFAEASVAAARKWTFAAPTTGEDKDNSGWTVRVPVSFALGDSRGSKPQMYGVWRAFIPGPRQAAPWRRDDVAQMGSDLLPAGGVYMVDGANRGLRLLTPLAKD